MSNKNKNQQPKRKNKVVEVEIEENAKEQVAEGNQDLDEKEEEKIAEVEEVEENLPEDITTSSKEEVKNSSPKKKKTSSKKEIEDPKVEIKDTENESKIEETEDDDDEDTEKSSRLTDIILVVAAIVAIAASIFIFQSDANKNNKLQELSYAEYQEKVDANEKFIVVIERTNCSYCQQYMPIVKKVAAEYDIDIYYINLENITSDEIESLVASNSFFEGEWGTPTTLYVEGSNTIDSINEYVEKDELVTFLKDNEIIE